ncbi:MAG: tetratricopeptide repeat protein, partial [Candidatus Omnitrophica bacterium]|nr:tetratricopeptide repeat protein [Candidatus Omnitrophota bacterium]
LIYIAAKRLSNKPAGIIAGFIASLYAPFIFYSGVLVPTSYVVFFYLLSSICFVRARKRPTWGRFLLFGIIVGLATLLRAGILLFALGVLTWLIIIFEDKKKAILGAVAAVVGVLLILIPVTIRNYIASNDIVFLTSHAGVNFYIGNNENADGTFSPPKWARTNIEGLKADSKTIAEKELKKPLRSSEVSSFYVGKAVDFIRSKPSSFLKLLWRKLVLFVNKQELYDVAHYQVRSDYIPMLKFPFIPFLVVGVFGLAGAFIAIRQWRRIAPAYIFGITYTLSILFYFVNSRYRIPFATLMILFSGFFISWLITVLKEKKLLKALSAALLCAALFFAVNTPIGINTAATGYVNLGSLYMENKQWNEAIEAFYKAAELDQTNPKPHNDISYIYLTQNRLPEAEKSLSEALSRDSDYPFAHINLGLLFEKRGNLKRAEGEYEKAIELNPNIPQSHNNLANVYEATGRRALAIEEHKRAIELDPYNTKTHYNLGVIYGRDGRLPESKKEFEEALELDPEFEPARKALNYF